MVLNTVASLFLSLSEGWFHMFSDSVTDIRNVEFTIMGLLQLTLTRSLYAIYNRCHICMRRHVVFNPPQ